MKKTKRKNNYKVIFMGTPDFAVPILNELINSDRFDLVSVYTQPDKKVGRDQKVIHSPVKELALKNNIEVFQPTRFNKDNVDKLKSLKPDLLVVAAYGKILPKEVLEIPKYGPVNVHGSLLPKYRGASPIQAAILNGDKKTGITFMLMDEKMDEGDMLRKVEVKIKDRDMVSDVHDKLSELAAKNIESVLIDWTEGRIKQERQNHDNATYTKMIRKEDGLVIWNKSAQEIFNAYRAYHPWPGIYTNFDGRRLKILDIEVVESDVSRDSGSVYRDEDNLCVACGEKSIKLNKVQLEGKKPMKGFEFMNGYSKIIGVVLK